MTRPLVTYPDVEREVVDLLAEALAGGFSGGFDLGFDVSDCTVAIGLTVGFDDDGNAIGWTRDMNPHIQVALDGTPRTFHPAAEQPTIRVTVWARRATQAKAVAQLARGHLLAHHGYSSLVGLFVAHDPDHDAELASFTVRATAHSVPITT